MAYEATKNYLSFIPIKIGDPLVVVHILYGWSLSIMTIPHWGLIEVFFITSSVFLIAYNVVKPSDLNLPINCAATSVSV